ncbi:unnamed protein product [Pleuronectes platessa]|uniref:Uncharacterized protein n=1 Tax=Pleuronectes platessa TaxID=8262 RepID=A0A9N7YTJ6_PLEPL|nr:unnamed protein product [Pleuronectes platessa]
MKHESITHTVAVAGRRHTDGDGGRSVGGVDGAASPSSVSRVEVAQVEPPAGMKEKDGATSTYHLYSLCVSASICPTPHLGRGRFVEERVSTQEAFQRLAVGRTALQVLVVIHQSCILTFSSSLPGQKD